MNASTFTSTAGANFTHSIGGEIITRTLDTLNSGVYYHPGAGKSSQSALYDFQKDVLNSYYTEKGLGAIVYAKA